MDRIDVDLDELDLSQLQHLHSRLTSKVQRRSEKDAAEREEQRRQKRQEALSRPLVQDLKRRFEQLKSEMSLLPKGKIQFPVTVQMNVAAEPELQFDNLADAIDDGGENVADIFPFLELSETADLPQSLKDTLGDIVRYDVDLDDSQDWWEPILNQDMVYTRWQEFVKKVDEFCDDLAANDLLLPDLGV